MSELTGNDLRMYKLALYTAKYYQFDFNKSYQDNVLGVIETLKQNPTGLITSLTVKTYYYLLEALQNGKAEKYAKNEFYADDFDLLISLNVIDIRNNAINPIYQDIIASFINAPITKSFAYLVSLIKGMVDTYGIIEVKKADAILSNFIKESKYNVEYVVRNSSLLSAFMVIENGVIYHRVLDENQRTQIINFRKKHLTDDFKMKMFKGTDYIAFASTYRMDEIRPYLPSAWFDEVFKDKRFNLELYSVKHLHESGIISDNVANKLEEIHKYYPKWALNGYSIQEYYDHDNKKVA